MYITDFKRQTSNWIYNQPPASNKNPEATVCERQVSVQDKRRLDCTFTKGVLLIYMFM